MKRRKGKKRWDAIAQRFPPDAKLRGAEVGVWKGQCSAALLSRLLNLTLYMIDRWESYSQKERKLDSVSKMPTVDQATFDAAEALARKEVRPFGRRAVIWKTSSREAVEQFDEGSLDFVFVDGDHSYEGVRDDIKLWRSKIKPGGWICGHDYTREGKRPGVTRAVDEAFGEGVETDSDSTWFWRVPCE